MTMRRTIGFSLALLVIAGGATAQTRDKGTSHQPAQPATPKPIKHGAGTARISDVCEMAYNRPARYRSFSTASEATPDSYLRSVRPAGPSETGKAAWYGLVGNYTANGERLDTVTPTAAHRSLPLSSYARVTSLDNGRSVIVKINDRGPQPRRFIIDLSPRAADEIDMRRAGVAAVVVEPVVFGPPTRAVPTFTAFREADISAAQQPVPPDIAAAFDAPRFVEADEELTIRHLPQ